MKFFKPLNYIHFIKTDAENLLKEKFDVVISDKPDYLFFSVFGNNHLNYDCKKIFFTGENIAPPLDYCDWSFSFDNIDNNKNYRLPLYLLYGGYYELIEKKIDDSLVDRKFCNFVVSYVNGEIIFLKNYLNIKKLIQEVDF